MAIRLGDLLVQNGVISALQLAEALNAQKAYGGRLGTNLIELGYISEQALAKFLSAQLKLPSASAAELDEIPASALSLVPNDLAEKYRIVPIALNGRRLSLAMADPTDLRAVDEVAFRTGCTIQPMVVPDVLLSYALEKHYGVRRQSRYVRLSGAPDSEFQVVQPTGGYDIVPGLEQGSSSVQLEERGSFMQLENMELTAQHYSLADASRELAASQQPGEALAALRRFISEHLAHSLFLAPRAGQLWGHSGERLSVSDETLRAFCMTPADSPLLMQMTQRMHVGFFDCASGTIDAVLAGLLGVQPHGRVMAVPVMVNGQLLGMYFCSGPRLTEEQVVAPVQTVATKTSYALQMIYLRKRILEPA